MTNYLLLEEPLLPIGSYHSYMNNRKITRNRVIIGTVIVGVLLLLWADLAVGIFNIPGFSGS